MSLNGPGKESCGTDPEAAARASFLKMTPRKWLFVCAFERFLKLLLPALPAQRVNGDSPTQPRNILVIEYWNLGDLAILVPFLRNLRESFPAARISLLINPALQSFMEGQGLVDSFIPVRVPWAMHFSPWRKYNPFSRQWVSLTRTILAMRKRQFDFAFSGRMDVRDNFLLWLSGASRRIGYGFGGGGILLTDRVAPDLSRPHRADIWLHLLNVLDRSPSRGEGGLQPSIEESAAAGSFLREQGIPAGAFLIGVHPGARMPVRRWGDDRFSEVARNVLKEGSVHILWFVDPANPAQVPQLERCHTVNLEFRSFVAVLAQCRLLICNDSGPMHMANLLSVPVVAVFGPQRPEWFGPRGPHDRVVIRSEFSCRPCFDYCIFDQPYCLRTITPDDVLREVYRSLREQCELDVDRSLRCFSFPVDAIFERDK